MYGNFWLTKNDEKGLVEKYGISTNSMTNMWKGMDVSTKVFRKICEVLDCKIEDIVEIERTEENA